jgi:hypothetical protein
MKILIYIFLFLSIIRADILDDKISNLIGKQQYQRNKNLINVLFANKKKYIIGNSILYAKVLKELKKNGLLHLRFEKPKRFQLDFYINNNNMKSIKILNDTLKVLGYYYFFVKKIEYKNQLLTYSIFLDVESIVDPYKLINELQRHNFAILDIHKEQNNVWSYRLDTNHILKNDIEHISTGEKIVFQKPLDDYFISIDDKAVDIFVHSRRLNHWYPYIVFYDKSLNVIDLVKEDKIYKSVKVKIPQGTKYIKVTDLFTLANIKRGLTITIK